ncbi:hypothetical protein V2G26_020448 [Clonostachys chloroleuca]
MSLPKQILPIATLLLSTVSTTAAAPVPSFDLSSRSTDEAGHYLQTRGEDVYLRFREAGEEGSIGETAKPKFSMKSKTTITKSKGFRESASEGYATKADSKKTKSRSGHRRHRGPERKRNAGGRNQVSSLKSMRKMNRNNNRRPVSPFSSYALSGHHSRVSAPS